MFYQLNRVRSDPDYKLQRVLKCHACNYKPKEFVILVCNHLICSTCIELHKIQKNTANYRTIVQCPCGERTEFNQSLLMSQEIIDAPEDVIRKEVAIKQSWNLQELTQCDTTHSGRQFLGDLYRGIRLENSPRKTTIISSIYNSKDPSKIDNKDLTNNRKKNSCQSKNSASILPQSLHKKKFHNERRLKTEQQANDQSSEQYLQQTNYNLECPQKKIIKRKQSHTETNQFSKKSSPFFERQHYKIMGQDQLSDSFGSPDSKDFNEPIVESQNISLLSNRNDEESQYTSKQKAGKKSNLDNQKYEGKRKGSKRQTNKNYLSHQVKEQIQFMKLQFNKTVQQLQNNFERVLMTLQSKFKKTVDGFKDLALQSAAINSGRIIPNQTMALSRLFKDRYKLAISQKTDYINAFLFHLLTKCQTDKSLEIRHQASSHSNFTLNAPISFPMLTNRSSSQHHYKKDKKLSIQELSAQRLVKTNKVVGGIIVPYTELRRRSQSPMCGFHRGKVKNSYLKFMEELSKNQKLCKKGINRKFEILIANC